MIERTPMGTLTKKIHSQPTYSVITPPRIGPVSVDRLAVAPQAPSAAPRRFRAKTRLITAMVCGVSRAAPSPWTARAAMSISMLPDRPHHSEDRVNTTMPTQ
jgi:hypothetical protein